MLMNKSIIFTEPLLRPPIFTAKMYITYFRSVVVLTKALMLIDGRRGRLYDRNIVLPAFIYGGLCVLSHIMHQSLAIRRFHFHIRG